MSNSVSRRGAVLPMASRDFLGVFGGGRKGAPAEEGGSTEGSDSDEIEKAFATSLLAAREVALHLRRGRKNRAGRPRVSASTHPRPKFGPWMGRPRTIGLFESSAGGSFLVRLSARIISDRAE
jgi:hypothetical protein